jgi:hypothetical protein
MGFARALPILRIRLDTPGLRLLDRPVEPGDDSEGRVN